MRITLAICITINVIVFAVVAHLHLCPGLTP